MTIFRLNIADATADDESLQPADLGELYQNQESDPQVADMMRSEWLNSDELPDLPFP